MVTGIVDDAGVRGTIVGAKDRIFLAEKAVWCVVSADDGWIGEMGRVQ